MGATRTATTALSTAEILSIEKGVNTKVILYNSLTDSISASSTVILLAKIPEGARITDVRAYHSATATTAALSVGINATPAAFIVSQPKGAVSRATLGIINYKVTISDTATVRYQNLTATIVPSAATTNLKISVAVDYVADGQ
jgi:hypothetical protein